MCLSKAMNILFLKDSNKKKFYNQMYMAVCGYKRFIYIKGNGYDNWTSYICINKFA